MFVEVELTKVIVRSSSSFLDMPAPVILFLNLPPSFIRTITSVTFETLPFRLNLELQIGTRGVLYLRHRHIARSARSIGAGVCSQPEHPY